MDFKIGHRYRLGKKIGHGAFGDIYQGTDTIDHKEIAIKLEPVTSRNPQLVYEAKAYEYLKEGVGFPKIYYSGTEETFNVMVMDLLGPSLEDLFRYCMGIFSIKTVCMLAQEMLLRLEFMHAHNFIHRDIKPDNFVVGIGDMANVIYLIDLGLCKRYRNPSTKVHISYRENKNLTGTPRYASIGNHLGLEQSRRDDLESLGYVLMYFLRGKLPWQGLRADNKKDKYRKIMNFKVEVPLTDLCIGFPTEFLDYLQYCRGLRFEESPDYGYLRGLFEKVMIDSGYVNDGRFDWMVDVVPHNPSVLAKYCVDEKGNLLHRLSTPANHMSMDTRELHHVERVLDGGVGMQEVTTGFAQSNSPSDSDAGENDTEEEEGVGVMVTMGTETRGNRPGSSSTMNNTSICSVSRSGVDLRFSGALAVDDIMGAPSPINSTEVVSGIDNVAVDED